ncbi:MAG TPA: hypothetical protein VKK79_03165 [Candidatus Lokiarchaeia archaeon]|nr:hypothetical protein [Candidatus Lokiarchaeia archaeon]
MADLNLDEVAKVLVYQQFYDEKKDVIFGRTKAVKVHIPGVGEVVEAFVREFTDPIQLLKDRHYMQYLNLIAKNLPIDVVLIEEKFHESLGKIDSQDLNEVIIATSLISEVLATLRDTEFKNIFEEIKQEARSKHNSPGASAIITTRLQEFIAQNENSVSLLYNLALLRVLAAVYGTASFAATINKLVQKYLRALVEKLTFSLKLNDE